MSDERSSLTRSLLAVMGQDQVTALAAFGSRRQFDADAVILAEGSTVSELHIILSGETAVSVHSASGTERVIATLGAGDAIGEMSLLTGEPASATVRATTAVELLCFDSTATAKVLAQFPAIERVLGAVVAQRLVRTQRTLVGHQPRLVYVFDGPTTTRHVGALAASAAWHARRAVIALLPGGTETAPDVIRRFGNGGSSEHGSVALVDDSVFGSLPQLAADLAGRCAAIIAVSAQRSASLAAVATIEVLPELLPTRQDVESVERGLLAPTSPYGMQIGRAARLALGLRIGVAFGAGNARGFAHAGVVDVLAERGIPIDAVSGSSIGSAVAGLVALGRDGDVIIEALERAGRMVLRPTLSKSSLLSVRHLARHFTDLVGEQLIEKLPIPTGLVATDLDTGEEVVFRRGLLRTAVLASIAIPGVYPPQHVGGRRLIDGAFVNPVPANVASSLGADVVIAVKLSTRARERVELEAVPGSGRLPWIPQTILRSVDAMSNAVARTLPGHAAVLIEPRFDGGGAGLSDFRKGGARFRAEGRRATESVMDELAALLPWLRNPASAG